MNPSIGMPPAPQTAPGGAPAQAPTGNEDPTQFGNYSDWAAQEMKNGFTADQLKQHLADNGVTVQQPHSGNWLTHLLPTIGSVAAPIIGGLLAPETGGLSLLAAAGLSGAGAAGGKAVENAAEGKNPISTSDLTAGAEGLIGGVAGGIAGKALGAGADALANRGTSIAAKEASDKTAQDLIDAKALTYADVPKPLQKLYNADDSLNHVSDMGFQVADPNNLVHVGNTSNDVLNEVLDRALANSGPVDLSNYPDIVKAALAKEGGTLGSFEKVALARGRLGNANTPAAKLLQQLEDIGNAPGETTGTAIAKTNADPNELRTLTTKLGQLAQDAKPTVTATTGAIDPEQRAIYNVINDVRNNVKSSLYDRPEVNDALAKEAGNLTPEDVGTQQLADHLNNVITQAGKGNNTAAQDLLSEMSRNIDIKNLGEEGLKSGQVVTSKAAQERAALNAGIAPEADPGNPLLDVAGAAANSHTGALNTVVNAAMRSKDNPKILATLSRIGGMGAKLAPAAGAVVATSPNLGADPAALAANGGAPGGTMGGTMQTQPTNGNDYQTLINAMEAQAILAPSVYGGTATPFLQSIAPMLQKNRLIQGELSALPESYANAGGAQGMGGIMSRISALIPGTAAHTYQQQQSGAAQALAQQLGISPEAAAGLLPQLMQNGGTAGMNSGILGHMSGALAY
jgi:hypothetical protein